MATVDKFQMFKTEFGDLDSYVALFTVDKGLYVINYDLPRTLDFTPKELELLFLSQIDSDWELEDTKVAINESAGQFEERSAFLTSNNWKTFP